MSAVPVPSARLGLVGRQAEWQQLRQRWHELLTGHGGKLLLLGGEPGIGKSRLAGALAAQAELDGAELITLRCSPDFRASSLLPLVRRLRRDIGLLPVQPLGEAEAALRSWVDREGFTRPDALPLLACLLGVRLPEDERIAHLSSAQRLQAHELLVDWLLHRGTARTLLLLVEDLHWADPSTLEVLGLLQRRAAATPSAQVLTLGTHRPEFQPPWPEGEFTSLPLGRLSSQEVEALLMQLSGGRRLPAGLAQAVMRRTDGVPLHVEEALKLLSDSGDLHEQGTELMLRGPLSALQWPQSLDESLQQRLGLHPAGREVAQWGAVAGLEFDGALLETLWTGDGARLQQGLQALLDAGLLLRLPRGQRFVYVFKHARVQEAAYALLGEAERRGHHARVVEALRERFPSLAAPELLAHHCIGAGEPARAVPLLLEAADQALQTSAHAEAVAHLHRGIELLQGLPTSPAHEELEAQLQIRLGVSLAALSGYAVQDAGQAYARALQLTAPDDPLRMEAQYGLWRFHFMQAQFPKARQQAEDLLARADQTGNEEFRLKGQRALTSTLFYMGELAAALASSERLLALPASQQQRQQALRYDVVDAWVTTTCYRAWIAWLMGDEASALRDSEAAIAAARQMRHPFSLALALSFASWLHQFRGDLHQLRACANEAQTLSQAHGFAFWIGWNEALLGWAVALGGAPRLGAEQIAAGTARWTANGSRLGLSFFLGLKAQALLRAQAPEAGMVIDQALRFAQETGEVFWRSELLRLQALWLSAQGADGQVRDETLREAAAVARDQQAHALVRRCERTRGYGEP